MINHCSISDGNFVLEETIDVVCSEIKSGWKYLAERLFDFDDNILQGLEEETALSYDEKLRKCFKLVKDKVTWDKLKHCLLCLNKEMVVEKAKATTLLTEGSYIYEHNYFVNRFEYSLISSS